MGDDERHPFFPSYHIGHRPPNRSCLPNLCGLLGNSVWNISFQEIRCLPQTCLEDRGMALRHDVS
jgi:hypothetical protein